MVGRALYTNYDVTDIMFGTFAVHPSIRTQHIIGTIYTVVANVIGPPDRGSHKQLLNLCEAGKAEE